MKKKKNPQMSPLPKSVWFTTTIILGALVLILLLGNYQGWLSFAPNDSEGDIVSSNANGRESHQSSTIPPQWITMGLVNVYPIDITTTNATLINNGSIWDLKNIDGETMNYASAQYANFVFRFSLIDIASNLSSIEKISFNMTVRTFLNLSVQIRYVYQNGTVGSLILERTAINGIYSYSIQLYPNLISDFNSLVNVNVGRFEVMVYFQNTGPTTQEYFEFDQIFSTVYTKNFPYNEFLQFLE